MKKFLTFALVCCLVFSSSSIVFATATQWDTSDQTNLSNIAKSLTTTGTGTLLRSVNSILTALTSTTQQGSLYNGVAYLYDIRNYASQIASGLNGTNGSFLEKIFNALTHTDAAGIVYSYVTDIYQKVTEIDNTVLSLGSKITSIDNRINSYDDLLVTNIPILSKALSNYSLTGESKNQSLAVANGHSGLFTDYSTGNYSLTQLSSQTSPVTTKNVLWYSGSPLGNLAMIMKSVNDNLAYSYRYNYLVAYQNYNSTRSILDWNTLSYNQFTPTSATNGIYTYLAGIQNPLARLAYVHASDEEIAARQKADANQTAVVDNFIDSSGSGAAAPSNFRSVSDLSSGFKDNIVTDASVSGIWNIFNSNNFGWFSQETADQLDTSDSSSRMLKSSGSYPTPLLNQQTEDILNYLGGNNND